MVTKGIYKVKKSSEDLRCAAVDMSKREAGFLVEDYYRLLRIQLATKDHKRILGNEYRSNDAMSFIAKNVLYIRNVQMRNFLDIWTDQFPAGKWAKSIHGIGPVISAGLVAFIDIDKCKNGISSLWRYAGQDPDSRRVTKKTAEALIKEAKELYGIKPASKHIIWLAEQIESDPKKLLPFVKIKNKICSWEKIEHIIRRPRYHPTLRTVCLSLGHEFMREGSMYQSLYNQRFALETLKSRRGDYKKFAKKQLATFNYKENTDAFRAYSIGKLPEGHIRNRAKRWAVKIFLAHYYMVEYYTRYKKEPPDVYALDILKGERKIHVPGKFK